MVKTNNSQEKPTIKMSIQVSLDGLSFCALNQAEKRIIFFREYLFPKRLNPIELLSQMEKIYDEEAFLTQESPEVLVVYTNNLYSLVPRPLFSENHASDYLKFNTRILETDFLAQDVLEDADMVNVYIPYTNINNFLFDRHGEFEYRHGVSVLTQSFLKSDNSAHQPQVFLNCYRGGYDLLVMREEQLLLSNSFRCHTREDFLYYLLFTTEQLDLDREQLQLILLGKIKEGSDYYQAAYHYFRNISFLETSFGFIFDQNQETPKGYMHYTLLKPLQ